MGTYVAIAIATGVLAGLLTHFASTLTGGLLLLNQRLDRFLRSSGNALDDLTEAALREPAMSFSKTSDDVYAILEAENPDGVPREHVRKTMGAFRVLLSRHSNPSRIALLRAFLKS